MCHGDLGHNLLDINWNKNRWNKTCGAQQDALLITTAFFSELS